MMICDIYIIMCLYVLLVFYKHNTAYELGISDCSSDVCSSVLCRRGISGPQRRVASGSGIPAPAIKRLGKPETSQCILTARANSGLPAPPRSTTEMAGRHWVSQDLSVAGLPHSTGRWPRLTGWAQCKTDRSSSALMALAAFTGRALSATRHRQRVNRLFGLSEPAQTGAKRDRKSPRLNSSH